MLVYIFACEGSYSRLHRMYEEDFVAEYCEGDVLN